MKLAMRIVLGIALLLYPVLVYLGLQHWDVRTLALVLLALLILRAAIFRQKSAASGNGGMLVTAIAVLVMAAALISNRAAWFLYYPVAMNLALLGLFAGSLLRPPSLIERIARLQDPELPIEGVAYTRKVTIVWSGFFVANGALAFYTARYCSLETWTLYNGLIAYILMGVLFAGEFVLRQFVMRRQANLP